MLSETTSDGSVGHYQGGLNPCSVGICSLSTEIGEGCIGIEES